MSITAPFDPFRIRVTGAAFNLVPGRDVLGRPWGAESELQRTTDTAGAPNVGAAATILDGIPPLPASGGIIIDERPQTTDLWWYRWRHKGAGVDPGNWSAWFSAKSAIIPKDVLIKAISAQSGQGVYPLLRAEKLTDGDYAVGSATPDGLQIVKEGQVEGQVRTLYTALTHLLPNGEFEVWQSASQPHAWTVDTGDASVAAKDTAVVFSGDAAAKYSFGAGGAAGTWRGFATNDPTKGGQCIPLRPGFRYRVIAASRASTLTGAPAYRLRFQHDAGATMTNEKQIVYRAANTYQRDEFVITVPLGADPNTKFWVEFQRNDTNAKDFWVDSVRFEEEIASLADQIAQLTGAASSFAVNGDKEAGTGYWRVSSASGRPHTMQSTAATPIEGSKSILLTIGDTGTTSRVQQCDRSGDIDDSTDGNPLYVPVQPLDEIWGTVKIKTTITLSASFLSRIEEYDSAQALIQRTTLASKSLGTIGTYQLYGGIVLQATTRYIVIIYEYPGAFTDMGGTIKVDALQMFRIPSKQRCHVYRSAAKSITSGTPTAIDWDTETSSYDIGSMHDVSTNKERITVNAAAANRGVIRLFTQIQWAAGTTGYRKVQIRKNGATVIGEVTQNGTNTIETTQQCKAIDNAPVAGDYYEVVVTHTQGAGLNVNNGQWVSYFLSKHEE